MFSALTRQVRFDGPVEQTQEVLEAILQGVVRELGSELVGHAKVIARTPIGVLFASTTGDGSPIHVNAQAQPDAAVRTVAIDFNCVCHGLARRRLAAAWGRTAEGLRQQGYRLVETPAPKTVATRRDSGTTIGLGASLGASFVALKPCCVLPALASISGGSLGVLQFLQPLEPYRSSFLALTAALLAVAFYRLYVRPQDETSDAVEASVRRTKGVFWLSVMVFVGAAIIPLLVPEPLHEAGRHMHTPQA